MRNDRGDSRSNKGKIPVNGVIQAYDLPVALQNEGNGSFYCEQNGQGHIAITREGHSLTSLRPVAGRKVVAPPTTPGLTPEPWIIQRLSFKAFDEFEGSQSEND